MPGGEDWRGSVPGRSVLRPDCQTTRLPDTPIYQHSTLLNPRLLSTNESVLTRPRYEWSVNCQYSGVETVEGVEVD